jgi:hypothetical protein
MFCASYGHKIFVTKKTVCMKKIMLRYGLLGGLIVASVMLGTTLYSTQTGYFFEGSMVIGYAAMILAFSLIFVALKMLRDKQYGGSISFGKAFKAAILITLVTSTIYVAAWLICYYFFIPDFMEQYSAHMLSNAKAKGASAAEIAKQKAQMQQYVAMYKNPLFVVLLTYMEILPVGLIVSVIASLIIKRKGNNVQHKESYVTGGA